MDASLYLRALTCIANWRDDFEDITDEEIRAFARIISEKPDQALMFVELTEALLHADKAATHVRNTTRMIEWRTHPLLVMHGDMVAAFRRALEDA